MKFVDKEGVAACFIIIMSSDETVKLLEPTGTTGDIKVYRKRWLVLAVFFFHLVGTNIAWITVGSIATEAECYYDVNVFWINSLSYVFYVTYVMFFGVATWFLERYGLRWSAIIGGCFNAAGTWLRFAGAGLLYTIMIHQCIILYYYRPRLFLAIITWTGCLFSNQYFRMECSFVTVSEMVSSK